MVDVKARLIRPGFWTDVDLAAMPAETRLFYVGLWMSADDAGYVSWDVDRIGAEMYPFRSIGWRRRQMPLMLDALTPQHVSILECGQHIVIPNLEKYQHAPRPSYQHRDQHQKCRHHVQARATTCDHVLARPKGKERKEEKEEKGDTAASGAASPFRDRMAAIGLKR